MVMLTSECLNPDKPEKFFAIQQIRANAQRITDENGIEIEFIRKIEVLVIIPAHNEEKYVKRCIKSINNFAQHFGKTVEIIVVCNRCTDKTEKKL